MECSRELRSGQYAIVPGPVEHKWNLPETSSIIQILLDSKHDSRLFWTILQSPSTPLDLLHQEVTGVS
eukprot:1151781-Pelagomonas_calceolata.AAC.1